MDEQTSLAEVDVLGSLLKKYGCSPTDAGFRRLAVLLAHKAGEISWPEYQPSASETLPDHTVAMLAESLAPDVASSRAAAARSVLATLQAWKVDRFSSADSIRVKLSERASLLPKFVQKVFDSKSKPKMPRTKLHYRRETEIAALLVDLVECGDGLGSDQNDERVTGSQMNAPQLTALEANALFPDQAVGQALLDAWWVGHLTESVEDVLPVQRCMLSGDSFAWQGHLDDGTKLNFEGNLARDAETSLGVITLTPRWDRQSRHEVRFARSL